MRQTKQYLKNNSLNINTQYHITTQKLLYVSTLNKDDITLVLKIFKL